MINEGFFCEDGFQGEGEGVALVAERGLRGAFEDDFEWLWLLIRRCAEDAVVAVVDDAFHGAEAVDDVARIARLCAKSTRPLLNAQCPLLNAHCPVLIAPRQEIDRFIAENAAAC